MSQDSEQKPQSGSSDTAGAPLSGGISDKNLGANHLRAWMKYRHVTGAALARSADTSRAVISFLVNGRHGLTAKWLRRIAPQLGISPGMLLDYDPRDLDSTEIDILLEIYSSKALRRSSSVTGQEGDADDGSNEDEAQSPLKGFVNKH
jgi:hypothetical protein